MFCKQTKTDGLNAPGVIDYIENPPAYTSTEELKNIFEDKKYKKDRKIFESCVDYQKVFCGQKQR